MWLLTWFQWRVPACDRCFWTAGAFVVAAPARRFIAVGVPLIAGMGRWIQKIRLVERDFKAAMLTRFQRYFFEAQAHSPEVAAGENKARIFA